MSDTTAPSAEPTADASEPTDAPEPTGAREKRPLITRRRLAAVGFIVVLVLLMLRTVLDPYGDKGYVEISHGNHVHYVPADRNPNVSISNFPTAPPGPDERILPNGQVVQR
ncbi:MAG: hypothetical protein SH809_00005 [Rhodothermales bacterium]|nr:hypothetical protein [Rhodothermales bacterium]